MIWTRSAPDRIESPPYFVLKSGKRYILGRDIGPKLAECLGGFDSADEAKGEAERDRSSR